MKQKIFMLAASIAISTSAFAQKKVKLEDNSNASNFYFKNGFVGINTQAPEDYFHIKSGSGLHNVSSDGNSINFDSDNNNSSYIDKFDSGALIFRMGSNYRKAMTIKGNGNVGINTDNPQQFLHILSGGKEHSVMSDGNSVSFKSTVSGQASYINKRDNGPLVFRMGSNFGFAMLIDSNRNVGIGTANPDAKLAVNGKIHAKEVKIDLQGWPDYVFQKYYLGTSTLKADYVMPTLEEVEAYTKANHHLPEMPSAKQLQENGLQVGDMVNKLLQKIEELTLYTIEQEKRLNAQQKEIETLKNKN